MRRRVIIAALLTGLISLAGCTDDGVSGGETKPVPKDSSPHVGTFPSLRGCFAGVGCRLAINHFSFADCHSWFMGFPADADQADQFAPQGYRLADDPALIGVDIFHCAVATNDRGQVYKDVWFFETGMLVVPPEGANDGTSNTYVFEFLLNVPEIVQELREYGIDAVNGTINQSDGPTGLVFDIFAAAELSYSVNVITIDAMTSNWSVDTDRVHTAALGVQAWMDFDHARRQLSYGTATMTMGTGVAATISLIPPPGATGYVAMNQGTLRLTPGQNTES